MVAWFWISILMATEATSGAWRHVMDDPGNAILAVNTADIAGPPHHRIVTVAAVNNGTLVHLGGYAVARVAIDCKANRTSLSGLEVKAPDGSFLRSVNPEDLVVEPGDIANVPSSVVAMACDGVGMTTPTYKSDVDFMAWAIPSLATP